MFEEKLICVYFFFHIIRCLEEVAEEFFLKPVSLSDMNKLKPHMKKTKDKNHQKQEKQEATKQPELQPSQQEVQNQQQQSNNNKRKAMEEGLSPDRARPRLNGLTVV